MGYDISKAQYRGNGKKRATSSTSYQVDQDVTPHPNMPDTSGLVGRQPGKPVKAPYNPNKNYPNQVDAPDDTAIGTVTGTKI